MAGVSVQFTGDASKLEREIIKLQAKAQELEARLHGVAAAGKKSGDDLDAGISKALTSITSLAAGFLSVNAALSAGRASWDIWVQNIREVGDEAKKANNELVVLAAMQSGGAKAATSLAAAKMIAAYGISDRAAGIDVIQSLQSTRGGDFAKGLAAAGQVFAANKLGVTLEAGKQAERIGASLGVEPGASLRRGYIAGQLSSASPEEVIKASPAMRFWDQNVEGWAAAGVISAGVSPDEVETYVRAAGIGLTGTEDKEFKKFLKKKGFRGGGQMETLRFLSSIGVDTPAEMAQAGIGEIRRQQGMAILSKNIGEMERFKAGIIAGDQPGLLEGQRGGIEEEMPGMKTVRQNAMLEAMYAYEKGFGKKATAAMEFESEQRTTGLALQRLGQTQLGPFDLIDEQGRFDRGFMGWRYFARDLAAGFGVGPSMSAVDKEEMRITRELSQPFSEGGVMAQKENPIAKMVADAFTSAMTQAFTKLDFVGAVRRLSDVAVRMRGGPTLVPANEDK